MSLHFKKDGTLDMRYSSSKAAVASDYTGSSPSSYSTSGYSQPSYSYGGCNSSASSGLHYKKDGTLDMRYKSSRGAGLANSIAPTSDLHHKKDGTLDMRYKSSREYVAKMENLTLKSYNKHGKKDQPQVMGIPRDVPVTKAGAPDLRTKKGKEWVQHQASCWHPSENIPAWVPQLKDGSPDMSKPIARHFMGGSPALDYEDRRDDYYQTKLQEDRLFGKIMQEQRDLSVPMVRDPEPVQATAELRQAFDDVNSQKEDFVIPLGNVAELNYARDLEINDDAEPLGRGGFGTVYRGKWNGEDVAIKKLHESRLTKKDRKMFIRETLILGTLGEHPNIVQLNGYTLNPVSLVMEYVPKGNLSYLLHYCEDMEVEAKMTDGRVKRNILLHIAYGMTQLHACHVTHGDLKPQNVLITDDFEAKIADFGLATFRAKTMSTTSSHVLVNDDKDLDYEGIAGGTAAYMAPELLDTKTMADEKTDVYSFGVLMNEVLHEEEPYCQNLRQFVGKGPFAAVLFAKDGNRPQIRDQKVTPALKTIIERCWSKNPRERPLFAEVVKLLKKCNVPHSC